MKTMTRGEGQGVTGGTLTATHLLDDEQLDGKCGMYARVSLTPGATLDLHRHEGNTETYYILSGEGLYNDDGVRELPARPGDVFFCEEGHSHAITATGDEDLVFMALIINK